jgi:hypothetical protein
VADRQLFDRPDADHRFHDLLLIAALAAGDLDQGDVVRATALAAGCPDCSALVADLQSITAAIATSPASARRRDFRLTARDAERLRPHGFGRIRSVIDGRRLQLARPLATGLTMLGLVGVLVTSLPTFTLGGAASAPAEVMVPSGDAFAASPAAQNPGSTGREAPDATDDRGAQPADESAAPASIGIAGESGMPIEQRSDFDVTATLRAAVGASDQGGAAPPAAQPGRDGIGADLAPIRLASLAVLTVGLVLLVGSTVLARAARRR